MFCRRWQIRSPRIRTTAEIGLKLHLIVDAIQDKPSRGQFDFETLKRDLRDLGSSLRAGFEEAIKNTRKLKQNAPPTSQQDWSREVEQGRLVARSQRSSQTPHRQSLEKSEGRPFAQI